ncbi:MAG: hypothetical protein ACK55Z_30990, partial [bacterium]
ITAQSQLDTPRRKPTGHVQTRSRPNLPNCSIACKLALLSDEIVPHLAVRCIVSAQKPLVPDLPNCLLQQFK